MDIIAWNMQLFYFLKGNLEPIFDNNKKKKTSQFSLGSCFQNNFEYIACKS